VFILDIPHRACIVQTALWLRFSVSDISIWAPHGLLDKSIELLIVGKVDSCGFSAAGYGQTNEFKEFKLVCQWFSTVVPLVSDCVDYYHMPNSVVWRSRWALACANFSFNGLLVKPLSTGPLTTSHGNSC